MIRRFKFTANLHGGSTHRRLSGDIAASNLANIANPPQGVTEWRSIDLKIRRAK
jgi:hypothetical protein